MIRSLYGRLALVVAPPIDTARFVPGGSRGPHYLTGSFMNPFKGLDVIVEAFSQMPAKQLVVFGDGPAATALKRRATPNVSFVGRLSDEELVARLQTARAPALVMGFGGFDAASIRGAVDTLARLDF